MKSIYIILLIIFTLSCQREERNQVGVGYNKTLIIPPTNDLPTPSSIKDNKSNIKNSNNNVINSILDQPEELVERLLAQCEYYGNRIVDRVIVQLKKQEGRRALALR